MGKVTITTLNRMKAAGEKIAVVTSYDASFTQLIEHAGMDVILVGDSLGMVIQGHESTLPVTVDDMVYHTANVARTSERALIIADMPFMSHGTPEQALHTAPFGQTATHELVRLARRLLMVLMLDVAQRQQPAAFARTGLCLCRHLRCRCFLAEMGRGHHRPNQPRMAGVVRDGATFSA